MRKEEILNSYSSEVLKKFGVEIKKTPKSEKNMNTKILKTGTTTAGLICKIATHIRNR